MANRDEECSICRESYREGDDKRTLQCGHVFHANCVEKWFLRKGNCPNCRARVAGDTLYESEEENDIVQIAHVEEIEEVVIVNGSRIPRYRGNLRYDPSLHRYITPEEGVTMYICGKGFWAIFIAIVASFLSAVLGFLLAENMSCSLSLQTLSRPSHLQVVDNGRKVVRNSGSSYWHDRLHKLNGIAGSVPVRFLPMMDIEVNIYYTIHDKLDVGDVISQIGFIPTQFLDKNVLIQDEHELVISVMVCHDDVICLAIINYGVTIKEIALSDSGEKTEFYGKLTLRRLQQNISAYLKTIHLKTTSEPKNMTGNINGEQASFQTTDMPNTPAPEGVYVHTFEKINNLLEDVWPVFVVNKNNAITAILNSRLFHETSCNKNVFIGNEGYSISNKRLNGFKRCRQNSKTDDKGEIDHTKFAALTDGIYSINPFRFNLKSYNFSVSCEFAKSLTYDSKGEVDIFQINLQTWREHSQHMECFTILVQLHGRNIMVLYQYNDTIIARDASSLKNSFALKKLMFSFEMNSYLHTVRLDVHGLDDNISKPRLFENIIFYQNPYVVLAMTDQAIVETKIS